ECTSDDEVIDLVQGGQGVFGIALGKVWRELEGSLSALPADRGDAPASAATQADELADRRAKRSTAS
ncbi:MAG: MerR family transcriptional regulator, partial [Demequina sp.]